MPGEIRVIDLRYTHGFNACDDVPVKPSSGAPKTSCPTFVLGDISTHLHYFSEIALPHLKIERLLVHA